MADEKNSKLASALKQAKQTPMFFAFVAKGTSGGALLVAKKKIPVKEINEAKAETGGKTVFQGRCFGEDGRLIFEVAKEPPGILAKQLKAVILESAGMSAQVETRVNPQLEEEQHEETGEESPGTPTTPPQPQQDPTRTRFLDKLKALAPVLKILEGIQNSQASDAKRTLVGANSFFNARKYGEALQALETVEGLVKQALLAAQAQKTGKTAGSEFRKRWPTARDAWQHASDTVDSQLLQLQSVLRSSGNEELKTIADIGLNGVTGHFKVPLLAIMHDLESAQGDALQSAIAKAKTIVANFRKHLQESEEVLVCDENPFDVKVTIRDSLGQALSQLEEALSA